MAAGKHVGKVLLKIRDEEKEPNQEPQPILLDALGRYSCSDEVEEKSYILCGLYSNLFISIKILLREVKIQSFKLRFK